ncbi:MAG TPA: hypothetical protein VKB50_03865 [Vicinamibacterales bacterium]|nr:hypothetical protein [Vicinamibacterales bacterium]
MGRQVLFHALGEDCQSLFSFINTDDRVTVVAQDSPATELTSLPTPCTESQVLILWKESLGTELKRTLVSLPLTAYYRVRSEVGLELNPSRASEWDGRPALVQGRLYVSGDQPNDTLGRWYDHIARWIRSRWTYSKLPPVGYIAPHALEWHRKGGLLLPTTTPPVTPAWTSYFARQLKSFERGV